MTNTTTYSKLVLNKLFGYNNYLTFITVSFDRESKSFSSHSTLAARKMQDGTD